MTHARLKISLFCNVVLSIFSSFVKISLREREREIERERESWLLYFNCVSAVVCMHGSRKFVRGGGGGGGPTFTTFFFLFFFS